MEFKPLLLLATIGLAIALGGCGATGTIVLNPDGTIGGGITIPLDSGK